MKKVNHCYPNTCFNPQNTSKKMIQVITSVIYICFEKCAYTVINTSKIYLPLML